MNGPCHLEHRSAPGRPVLLFGRPVEAASPALVHALWHHHTGYDRDEAARRGFRVRRTPSTMKQKTPWRSPFDDVPRGHHSLNDAILRTIVTLLERGEQPTETEIAARFGFSERQAKRYLTAAAERLEAA